MNHIFGNLGVASLAVALTAALILGTKAGGKLPPLKWTPCLLLGCLAGSAYSVAGGIFGIVPSLVKSLTGLVQGMVPGLTMGGLALVLAIVIAWKKLTTRQVAILGILFWYVAAGTGGTFAIVANAVTAMRDQIS